MPRSDHALIPDFMTRTSKTKEFTEPLRPPALPPAAAKPAFGVALGVMQIVNDEGNQQHDKAANGDAAHETEAM